MLYLILALLALVMSAQVRSRKYVSMVVLTGGFFYGSLIVAILSTSGMRGLFGGGEAGLLGWFVGGLVFSLLGFLLPNKPPVAILVAAVCYAMGFDVLQPDPYSYVPAAILAALILVVAFTAYQRVGALRTRGFSPKLRNSYSRGTASRNAAIYIFCVAILVYASTFKVIDRGWLLPWNYLAAAGGILFAVSQLWIGLKAKGVPLWAQVTAGRLGELLMVVSVFFVYREFL